MKVQGSGTTMSQSEPNSETSLDHVGPTMGGVYQLTRDITPFLARTPSFKRPRTNTMHYLSSLLFDMLDHIGPGQAEYTPPQFKYDVREAIVKVIHLCLLLGLFVDQITIPVHLCHQPVVPGTPHRVVDVEPLGIHGVQSAQVIWGITGGCPAHGMWHDDCREVMDGGIGSCHAESVGIVLHVNGDIPSLLHAPSFFDQEGNEPGGYVLPELWQDSSFLRLVCPLVSLPSVEYRASCASSCFFLSSGVVSSCIASLQHSFP